MDFATVSVGLGWPDIIDKHNQNVRRILGQMANRWQWTVDRFLHGPPGGAAGRFGRKGQNLLRCRWTRKGGA